MKLRIRTQLGIFAYDPNTDHIFLANRGAREISNLVVIETISNLNNIFLGALRLGSKKKFFDLIDQAPLAHCVTTPVDARAFFVPFTLAPGTGGAVH